MPNQTVQMIGSYTNQQLIRLQHLPTHPQKAAFAKLRSGVGYAPGEIPDLWGAFLKELPENLASWNGYPSKPEWAIYLALTLYASHQQGLNVETENMHQRGISLGSAVARLVPPDQNVDDNAFLRRLNILAMSNRIPAISHYLRTMISLLRSHKIPLDYAQLAMDLFFLQVPATAPRVRLKWGQDYFSGVHKSKKTDKND